MSDLNGIPQELLDLFFEESFDGIDRLENGLLRVSSGAASRENIDDIFRAAHSIKGGAGSFGFSSVTELAHYLESLLDQLRSGKREISSELTQLLLEAVDGLRETIQRLRDGQEVDAAKNSALRQKLQLFHGREESSPVAKVEAPKSWRIKFAPHPTLLQQGNDPARLLRELERLGKMTVEVDASRLPTFSALVPEECHLAFHVLLEGEVSRAQIDEVFAWVEGECDLEIAAVEPAREAAAEQPVAVAASTPAFESQDPAMSSIRVGIEKVDLLMNMVGELVITQSMLGEVEDDRPLAPERLARLREGLTLLARNTRAIQESVMRLRSMPVSTVFNRLPRVVHDISAKLGKQVELKLSGQNTEIDKTVLENLGDPLVHLLRNSLDHGIEAPEARVAAGKPATGTICLSAFHRGSDIVVEIKDDGRGIDREKVLKKAIANGIVAEGVSLTDDEILDLIFAPGLSTAEKVTDVSGRGVGMDVVRRNVRALGGEISVESQQRQGTRIVLRLPLTLAIIDGQLIRVGPHPYVVPLLSIVESVQIDPGNLKHLVGQADVYRLRNKLIPVVALASLLGIEDDGGGRVEDKLLVVVEADGTRLGLLVDELSAQQQVVVKSLEANYGRVPGLAGATILGDGNVAFILDVAGLSRLVRDAAGTKKGNEQHEQHFRV